MSNSMYYDFRGQCPAEPSSLLSDGWDSSVSSSPQPRLRRANAIRRVDLRTARKRRDEPSRLRSPTGLPRIPRKTLSFADLTTRYEQDMNITANTNPNVRPHNDVNVNVNLNSNSSSSSNGNDNSYWSKFVDSLVRDDDPMVWTFDEMRRFLDSITSFIKHGIPADELGRYLCLLVYGKDKFLAEVVTNCVNANITYAEIALRVLRTSDLRDNDGNAVYLQLQPAGNPHRRPNRPYRYLVNRPFLPSKRTIPYSRLPSSNRNMLTYENPDTIGPLLICPKPQVRKSTSVLQERLPQDFLIDSELRPHIGQAVPVSPPAADEQMNMKVDEGQINSDNYSDMVDEDDDVRMLDLDEDDGEVLDTTSEGNEYFAQNLQIQQAQAVHYTKPTSPPRFYAEIDAEKRRLAARRSGGPRSPGANRGTNRSNGQANRLSNVRFSFL